MSSGSLQRHLATDIGYVIVVGPPTEYIHRVHCDHPPRDGPSRPPRQPVLRRNSMVSMGRLVSHCRRRFVDIPKFLRYQQCKNNYSNQKHSESETSKAGRLVYPMSQNKVDRFYFFSICLTLAKVGQISYFFHC